MNRKRYVVNYRDVAGQNYVALQLPWRFVAKVLARPYRPGSGDDRALIAYLLWGDHPAWLTTGATTWHDRRGWGVVGPPSDIRSDRRSCGPGAVSR